MGGEPAGQAPRSRWITAAVLAGLIAATGAAGAAVALLQRSPTTSPPGPTPHPTPFVFPTSAPTPVPRGPVLGFGFSVADDPATHQVVVFGGVDSYDTTWLWNGSRWTLAKPHTSPPGRFGAAIAYDPASHMVLLFGGRLGQGIVEHDTWGWDGTTWRELDTGVNGPPPGEGAQMAWDNSRAQMLLVAPSAVNAGGETWTWVSSHWTRDGGGDLTLAPFGGAMSYDPISRSLVLVNPEPPDGTHTSTLRWTGTAWRIIVSGGPAVAGLALDPQSGGLVLVGAKTYSTAFAVQSEVWQWTGSDWIPSPGAAPPVAIAAEVEDVDRDQILIFGSTVSPTQGSPQPVQVWYWDGVAWVPLG